MRALPACVCAEMHNTGADPDFEEAVNENCVAIAKKEAMVADLKKQLEQIEGAVNLAVHASRDALEHKCVRAHASGRLRARNGSQMLPPLLAKSGENGVGATGLVQGTVTDASATHIYIISPTETQQG